MESPFTKYIQVSIQSSVTRKQKYFTIHYSFFEKKKIIKNLPNGFEKNYQGA